MLTEEITQESAEMRIAEMYRGLYEALLHKVNAYYFEELKLRGDKILNREYRNFFGIDEYPNG